MTAKIINLAQGYLTVNYEDRPYQIVNIKLLLKRHPPEEVISFLQQLYNEYGKKLKRLISRDWTNPRVNEIVARRFRIRMAITIIQINSKEVDAA